MTHYRSKSYKYSNMVIGEFEEKYGPLVCYRGNYYIKHEQSRHKIRIIKGITGKYIGIAFCFCD